MSLPPHPAPAPIIVRPCFLQDIEQITLIYAHHVYHGAGTFEIEPPSQAEMEKRWSEVIERGWPYLVASPSDDFSRVLGFAYARQFRDRAAYEGTFEDSVYVAPNAMRRGIGSALLVQLLAALKQDSAREVLALIGDSQNTASIAVHRKAGFTEKGVLKELGVKFGRTYDVVMMQRNLSRATLRA
jgi:phosphinothricin acetyltransferase